MVIFCFEASKDIFAYDNGIPKPASHDASCAQGFGYSSLYAQGTYVIGSCDTFSHIDIEGCLRWVRECFFWRRIASDVKENVFECDV